MVRLRVFRLIITVSLVLIAFSFPAASPSRADGNNALAPSRTFTIQGNTVSAGVGLRGTGEGTITITGVPGGATIYRAYLYWATLGNVNTYTSPALNGEQVNGDLIGRSGDTCWGVQNNFVYRADVTGWVAGNGSYTISNLPSDIEQGNDSQGASLVVIYQDTNQPFRTIVINDGAVTLDLTNHTYTNQLYGYRPDNPVTEAKITYLVGDGQERWEAGSVSFNGQELASGVFSGVDGDFWGTHTFFVTNYVSSDTSTTTINNYVPGSSTSPDCLVWAATIFTVTTEIPEESTEQLSSSASFRLFGDVTAAGVGLRGVGQGDINLSGIPSNAVVQHAFLYWATIGNSSGYISPTLNGEAVNGELIGISGDTCWEALHNYVYRADVTGFVQGNGSYTVAGLPNNLPAGNDSQGASLVVIYRVGGVYRTVLINDGAVTLDFVLLTYTDTLTGYDPNQPNAQAFITYLVGDGQERWDTGNVTFNGSTIANNVFTGVDGNYWGTLTFDVTGLVNEPTSTTTLNNNDPDNPVSPDCLLWAASILSVQTDLFLGNPVYIPLVLR